MAILSALIILALAIFPKNAQAKSKDSQCGTGEVQSALQALPIGFLIVDNDKAGLGAGIRHCLYTPFEEGTTFAFDSSDHILGGFANFIPLELLGVTRQEGIELLLDAEDRIFLGPVGTPDDQLVEQELTMSAFKDMIHPELGHIVYQTKGFITELEPGTYLSRYVWRWPLLAGDETVTNTVYLQID
jgi:hypothetical protein